MKRYLVQIVSASLDEFSRRPVNASTLKYIIKARDLMINDKEMMVREIACARCMWNDRTQINSDKNLDMK